MKILYAIQATGNGHISRAKVLIPYLQKNTKVDILISGTSADIELGLPIRFKLKGLSFVFGKNGGINIWRTIRQMNFWRFFKDVLQLPLKEYDFVINDFEPVSAWACVIKKKHCIALSHQFSLLNEKVPKPKKKARISDFILTYYAPAKVGYGFHFKAYTSSIYNPIIQQKLKSVNPSTKNYIVVYLPAFSDEKIISVLSKIYKTNWIIFSKHTKMKYSHGNIKVRPISSDNFNEKLIHCSGVLCGAGFETPAEALYLKKRLLVIPMKNQYEQQCNAEALKDMGVSVIYDLNQKNLKIIEDWIKSTKIIQVDYSESPQKVINQIITDYVKKSDDKRLREFNSIIT